RWLSQAARAGATCSVPGQVPGRVQLGGRVGCGDGGPVPVPCALQRQALPPSWPAGWLQRGTWLRRSALHALRDRPAAALAAAFVDDAAAGLSIRSPSTTTE
ncbi:hypothetical protein HK405_008661, partial [Cladochytrium tenue]